MNNQYLFQDQTIGIYEHQIDLLRNGYVYDRIEYRNIKRITLIRGLNKNWILLFCLGIAQVILSAFITIYVYKNSNTDDFVPNLLTFWSGTRGRGLVAIQFLFFFGIFFIINSFIKKHKLVIETNNKKQAFEIGNIAKSEQLSSLIDFLKERVSNFNIDYKTNL